MDQNMWNLSTLVLEGPVCFMQQGIKFTKVWDVMCFFSNTLIWCNTPTHPHCHAHTQTETHTKHDPRDWINHTKYILMPSVMCSQQLSVLHWMNNLETSKIYITEFHNIFAFQTLLTCKSHIYID